MGILEKEKNQFFQLISSCPCINSSGFTLICNLCPISIRDHGTPKNGSIVISGCILVSLELFSHDFDPQGLLMKKHTFLELQLPVAKIGLLCSGQVYLLFESYKL